MCMELDDICLLFQRKNLEVYWNNWPRNFLNNIVSQKFMLSLTRLNLVLLGWVGQKPCWYDWVDREKTLYLFLFVMCEYNSWLLKKACNLFIWYRCVSKMSALIDRTSLHTSSKLLPFWEGKKGSRHSDGSSILQQTTCCHSIPVDLWFAWFAVYVVIDVLRHYILCWFCFPGKWRRSNLMVCYLRK